MKPSKYVANAMMAIVPVLSLLIVGCKGETPSAPSTLYVISANAGANGKISPAGNTQVRQGGTLGYAITANAGFVIADVQVDGSSVGAVKSYTFSGVTASHAIGAIFKPEPPANLVTNPGMESADPADATKPMGWVFAGWGNNVFTNTWLPTGGRSNSHALQIDITSYTDGSHEWYFTPILVDAGKRYDVSIWYKGDAPLVPGIAWLTNDIDHITWGFWPPAAPAAADWTECTFTTDAAPAAPVNKLTILPIIKQVGTLTIDDVSVLEHVD